MSDRNIKITYEIVHPCEGDDEYPEVEGGFECEDGVSKILIREIRPYVRLYRDPRTGIAWVEDGRRGDAHSCHPNIDSSGSVRGMKKLGYWDKDARTVRSHGYIYNVDRLSVSGELDELARQHCQCPGNHRLSTHKRWLAAARPHGVCDHADHCVEHERDASVESCK